MGLDNNFEILDPKSQLRLYGFENYFSSFKKLYEKNILPNVMLLSGPKGSGKSTFAYHFINYVLSEEEENKYSVKNFQIDSNNSAFKLINNNIHPNFFLLGNNLTDKNIKIDQVRKLLSFLNKSTYAKNLKIVFLDNVEYLNLNSSNALLKGLEEPSQNTFFFIIHDNSSFILDTIKSRCVQFKFNFTTMEKKNIFKNVTSHYNLIFNDDNLEKFLSFESPGNLLKYLMALQDSKLDISKDNLSCILFLLERYKTRKDSELLNFITVLIENYYYELSSHDAKSINNFTLDKNKISYLIYNTKKFNLDKENLVIDIYRILKNET